jgi:spiro-SPASM protein
MRNLAIINIAGLSPLAYEPVLGGPSAFERIQEWSAAIPEASGTVFLAGPETEVPEGTVEIGSGSSDEPFAALRVIRRDPWSEEVLIEAITVASRLSCVDEEGESRAEALFYVWGDSPLMDGELTSTLWNIHYKYDAEYTFADGYPVGLAPEILSAALPEKLIHLASGRKLPPARDSLFEVLRQDINAFDVETHLSPKDLRMDRVSITCDTRRNLNIAEGLFKAGAKNA